MIKKESPSYKLKEIDILKFLSSRITFFDEVATIKDISLNLEADTNFLINMNEYECERIIDNTISNAIKYSHSSSEITIYILKQNDNFILQIIDKGMGIEDTDTIFTPYFQQSSENLGFGLGLTIVKEICDKYDIKIDVQSKKDEGSIFTYDFTSIAKEIL